MELRRTIMKFNKSRFDSGPEICQYIITLVSSPLIIIMSDKHRHTNNGNALSIMYHKTVTSLTRTQRAKPQHEISKSKLNLVAYGAAIITIMQH